MSETNGLFPRIVLSGSLGAGRIIAGDYVLRITDIENGHRLTVSKGNDIQTMDVLNGETGAPGPAGQPGQPGQDGVSPTVSVTEIEGGHRVTITDATGSHVFDVMDGEDDTGAVQSVNGQTGAVVLDAEDVGALPNSTEIPEALADLTDDSTHRVVTDVEKAAWNAKQEAIGDLEAIRNGAAKGETAVQPASLAQVATSGNYNDLSNKPSIPSAVTEQTVSGWGFTKNTGTYSKPSGGIPKTDLDSGVQSSLGKADSAYQKPSTGVPKTDLATSVQTSLGKADSALQGTDTTLAVSGKAADAKATGDAIDEVKDALSESVSTNEQTFSEAQQMQARKNLGLYHDDVKIIEWDGDTEGRAEIPQSRYTSLYRVADTDITESNIDLLIGAQVQIDRTQETTGEHELITETVLNCDEKFDKVFELVTTGSYDFDMIYLITETITVSGITLEKGIYFAKFNDNSSFVKSIIIGVIHKIEEKYLPDFATESYVNQQISAAIADVDTLLGSGVIA